VILQAGGAKYQGGKCNADSMRREMKTIIGYGDLRKVGVEWCGRIALEIVPAQFL